MVEIRHSENHETADLAGQTVEAARPRSHRLALLVGAILLALGITGGLFAYTATSDTIDFALTAQGDYASVTANATPPTWDVFGKFKGTTDSGHLFAIEPASGFTGDLSVSVLLTNADELTEAYRTLVMRIVIYDSNVDGSIDTGTVISPLQVLSLTNGEVSFDIATTSLNGPYAHVYLDGGFYISNGAGWTAGFESPNLLADVYQKGT